MTPVAIAGGGLAGAAAAIDLAKAGRLVALIERSTGPADKICGEFLSAEAQHYLTRLGLDLAALGGHVITTVRLVRGARMVEAELPFRGLGLSRRVLDEALLQCAAVHGVEVRRGETVSTLSPEIRFLATGKHDLRDNRRAPTGPPEELVGFKTYFRLDPVQRRALSGAVEVILFQGGYAGLQLVEGGRANLCLLVHRDRLARAGGSWEALLADLQQASPHLRQRLAGAAALLERPLTIARVPYGFIHRAGPAETVFRLGDQACVIPSFSGDGMSMALHSAALAVQHYCAGGTPAQYHARLRQDVAGPIRRAMALYGLGRSAPGQVALLHALRLWPTLLRHAARATRLAEPVWLDA
jgi:flavin-dependent dehydrogenase